MSPMRIEHGVVGNVFFFTGRVRWSKVHACVPLCTGSTTAIGPHVVVTISALYFAIADFFFYQTCKMLRQQAKPVPCSRTKTHRRLWPPFPALHVSRRPDLSRRRCPARTPKALRDAAVLEAALEHRAFRLLKRVEDRLANDVKEGRTSWEAWNRALVEVTNFCMCFMCKTTPLL